MSPASRIARSYGTGRRQPTGAGLPDYQPGRFDTRPPSPPLASVDWCDQAGCPREECVACKAVAR